MHHSPDSAPHDLALIGMACRFPGGNLHPRDFFQFLLNRGDGIVPVPADRWENKAWHDADKEKKNRMYVDRGGFLAGIDQFDPLFFGISPAEATRVDPQHRWLLELTYELLENAGLRARELRGSDTAVYIGQFMHDYEQLQLDAAAHGLVSSHSATGPSMTLTANRISYVFDFRGPSVALDTACSSSLVALDLACRAVLSGDSRLAIAGGVNILLRPELTLSICKASMLSPDGACKSFDASANGYVRSEGAGLVLVKRLSEAQRDGDTVLAVIKATGVNQDGQTPGITVPSGAAQRALLLRSLQRAGLGADQIQYAEAHGTGTAVGDPIEVNALGSVLGVRPIEQASCVIGSVKSNIGHTEAAAGMAGLIKTVFAMRHGVIPPNIRFNEINPAINLAQLNLRVADAPVAWPDTPDRPRCALVNSFGFGGTNANVILQEAPSPVAEPGQDQAPVYHGPERLLPLSAETEQGLKDQATRLLEHLRVRERQEPPARDGSLHDVCYTAAVRREHHTHRLVVRAVDEPSMCTALESWIAGQASPDVQRGTASRGEAGRTCFVFSGMGTQWAGMGRQLYQAEPVFREVIDRCSRALEALSGWSLVEELFAPAERSRVAETFVAQPAIFAVQVALTALLETWGIRPHAVVGHSAGEVAAAHVAGALDFDDAVRVIFHRSRLQQTTEGLGTMLAVGLSAAAVQSYLAGETSVSIAAINSPDALTLSGDHQALTRIARALDQQGVFARFLKVGVPYHSPAMDRLRTPMIDALEGLTVREPKLALYSTVSGDLTKTGDWGPEYWPKNVREPVLFMKAIEAASAAGCGTFIEVAPHAALSSSIEKTLAGVSPRPAVVATLRREQGDTAMMAATLGALHVHGFSVDWARLYPKAGRLVYLPNYAWQHASYWCEEPSVRETRLKNLGGRASRSAVVHPLLGAAHPSARPGWISSIDLQDLPFLSDHRVEDEPVYPAAGYIEMALAVAAQGGQGRALLEEIRFERALFLAPDRTTPLDTTFDPSSGRLEIHAQDAQSGQWSRVSGALLSPELKGDAIPMVDRQQILGRCTETMGREVFYRHCHQLGLSYAGRFQPVERVHVGKNEVLAEVVLPTGLAASLPEYHLHPVLLDGAFQGIFAAVSIGYLPVRIESLRCHQAPGERCYSHIRILEQSDEAMLGDLEIFDDEGRVAVEIRGIALRSTKTRQASVDASPRTLMYEDVWQLQETAPAPAGARTPGTWVLLSDRGGVAERLAARLEELGQSCSILRPPASGFSLREELVNSLRGSAAHCQAVLYLSALDYLPDAEASADEMLQECMAVTAYPLQLVQAMEDVPWSTPPRLLLVTRGAHTVSHVEPPPVPVQGALWGFGRVVASEHPGYRPTLLDLPRDLDAAALERLPEALLGGELEDEISVRASGVYRHRLRALGSAQLTAHAATPQPCAGDEPFALRWAREPEGVRAVATALPLPDLSESEVCLRTTLAALSGEHAAGDAAETGACVGTVTCVGSSASRLRPGTVAVGYARPALASLAAAEESLVVRKPEHLTDAEGLALAAAFVPAYHALDYLAMLREGEHVLIHQAGDPVGLAAVQFARLKGAVVHATCDQPADRARLRTLGVAHLHNALSGDYLAAVGRDTGGRGVDVVVHAAAPHQAARNAALLKPCGRFVDCTQRGGAVDPALLSEIAARSGSYHRLDFSRLITARPDRAGQLLREVAGLFESRLLHPCTLDAFEVGEIDQALSRLVRRSPLDRVAVVMDAAPSRLAPGQDRFPVKREGTYLVTGGLGGLGLELLTWLVKEGARSVVLIGRSEPGAPAQAAIQAARAAGATVTTQKADVSERADVARVLRTIEETLPPLAGVFHAAGVLDDGTVLQQTPGRFLKVFGPKVAGAWNLHRLTAHLPLEIFACFSSIASVVGWSGQSNYAAANAFMDTLARHRRARGLPAVSVNWGPWSGSGMAAKLEDRDQQRMREAGMSLLTPGDALGALRELLAHHVVQAGVFEVDWARLLRGQARVRALFADLTVGTEVGMVREFAARFAAVPAAGQEALVLEEISTVLAAVLGLESAAGVDRARPVSDYGVNSLMAMELRNRLQLSLKLKLPSTFALKHPTVEAMGRYVLEQLRTASAPLEAEVVYWDPAQPEMVHTHEINGPLAALTPSVLNWIHEGHDAHFNVGSLLEMSSDGFDLDALRTALRIVFAYHDGCRLQIVRDGDTYRGEIASLAGAFPLLEFDYRGLGYEQGAARMEAKNDELQASFRFERGQFLFRAAYYQLDDANPHRLLIIFHHYVSDAISQHLFGQTLSQVYARVRAGQRVTLPAKAYSLIDWTQRLHAFAHGEAAEQLPYWLDTVQRSRGCLIKDEFVSGRPRRMEDYRVFTQAMGADASARVSGFCRERGVEFSDLGTYAVVHAFGPLSRSRGLWVDLITHARSGIFDQVAIPQLFGQISESASILFELAPGATHLEQITRMREQRLAPPNGGIGLRALRFLNQDPLVRARLGRDESPQVGLNFDLIDYGSAAEQSWIRFARERAGRNQSEHLRKTAEELRLAFFLSIRLRGGRYVLEIAYYRDRFHDATIERFAEALFGLLGSVAADPEARLPAPPPAAVLSEHMEPATASPVALTPAAY